MTEGGHPSNPPRSGGPGDQKLLEEVADIRERRWWVRGPERFLTLLSAIIAAGGFVVGLAQYSDTKAQEFRRRFWEKQLEAYSATATAAASASLAADGRARDSTFGRFTELYQGQLMLLADDSAAFAAKEFYQTFIDYVADPRKQARTQSAARAMSDAFRRSLLRGVNDPFAGFTMRE